MMKIPLEAVIQLLHSSQQAALATHSLAAPGYPFVTYLPMVPDAGHCPVFLLSNRAEHTRNIEDNPLASMAIQACDSSSGYNTPRLTLLGKISQFNPNPALLARYLRYQPETKNFLELGSFDFYRLEPSRLRLVAGFGQMGWIEAEEWSRVLRLPYDQENALLAHAGEHHGLLGIDCYGVDSQEHGRYRRMSYPRAIEPDQLSSMLTTLGMLI